MENFEVRMAQPTMPSSSGKRGADGGSICYDSSGCWDDWKRIETIMAGSAEKRLIGRRILKMKAKFIEKNITKIIIN